MKQLISQITPLQEYDKRNGWLTIETSSGIRNLLKKQALLLLEKQGYDINTVTFNLPQQSSYRHCFRRLKEGFRVREEVMMVFDKPNRVRRKKTSLLYVGEKNQPMFSSSTDSIAKEMPLDLFESAQTGDDDLSDEGFQVFGDYDEVEL